MKKTYVIPSAICRFNEWWMRPLLNLGASKEVVWERKIKYCDDENLYLNVCDKKEPDGEKRPVFVYIHGGGWVSGKPETREGVVSKIVEKGFLGISIYYGYAPKYGHPEAVQNIYKALAWLVDNAEKYNADISRIYVGGESAGAHLTATVGAIYANEEYKSAFDLEPKSKDLKISGLVLICGVYDMEVAAKSGFPFIKSYIYAYFKKPLKLLNTEEGRLISPAHFITEAFPASFHITAAMDALRHGGAMFYDQVKSKGVKCVHYYAKGAWSIHAFAVAQALKLSKIAMKGILEFLSELENKDLK
ncbi:MAG TPA: alpha/beta hydrolase [Eubacteriales bacterium]|mgnify:CR=1 FL=1|jgi:acetyl esterase/lipase|nr:alpha/beta hydrolase [Clostridia bacterium]HRR89615.1 alpha/beta hydrolase [Eubacteriales bacterium]HRU84951.1 alpha/beta hydrolase [Eubacteriales bacterium]